MGYLIEDDIIVVEDVYKCFIITFFSIVYFDILCYFLGGSLKLRFWDSMIVEEAVEEMFSNDNDIMDRIWGEFLNKELITEGSEDELLIDDFGENGVSMNNEDEDDDFEDEKSFIDEFEDVVRTDRRNFLL